MTIRIRRARLREAARRARQVCTCLLVTLSAACGEQTATPRPNGGLSASALLGEWTTEGGSGPTVLALLITGSHPELTARLRFSGVERMAQGRCGADRCVLYFSAGDHGRRRVELQPLGSDQRLRVLIVNDSASTERSEYVLVRASGG